MIYGMKYFDPGNLSCRIFTINFRDVWQRITMFNQESKIKRLKRNTNETQIMVQPILIITSFAIITIASRLYFVSYKRIP